jgi:hypothetical protein
VSSCVYISWWWWWWWGWEEYASKQGHVSSPIFFPFRSFFQCRETVREVAVRGDKMLDILRARAERNIVVVSHGVFLETLLNRCSLACVDEGLRSRRFDNAEMRSVVMGGWGPVAYAPQLPVPGRGALAQIVAAQQAAGVAGQQQQQGHHQAAGEGAAGGGGGGGGAAAAAAAGAGGGGSSWSVGRK